MTPRSATVEAIVLKRHNYQEADRFITVFSRYQGKVEALAKGVRKLSSRKRPALEPGNHVKLSITTSTHLPLITEAILIHPFTAAKANLPRITQLHQLLEIVDLLTVETESHPQVFNLLQQSLRALETNGHKKDYLLENIRLILQDLGFTYDKKFSEGGLRRYIEDLGNRNLRSKAFLTVT